MQDSCIPRRNEAANFIHWRGLDQLLRLVKYLVQTARQKEEYDKTKPTNDIRSDDMTASWFPNVVTLKNNHILDHRKTEKIAAMNHRRDLTPVQNQGT